MWSCHLVCATCFLVTSHHDFISRLVSRITSSTLQPVSPLFSLTSPHTGNGHGIPAICDGCRKIYHGMVISPQNLSTGNEQIPGCNFTGSVGKTCLFGHRPTRCKEALGDATIALDLISALVKTTGEASAVAQDALKLHSRIHSLDLPATARI